MLLLQATLISFLIPFSILYLIVEIYLESERKISTIKLNIRYVIYRRKIFFISKKIYCTNTNSRKKINLILLLYP